MAANLKKNDSENIKVIVGKLIDKAEPSIRPVISVFDCFQSRSANTQRLNQFTVGLLESCADFLGFKLADQEGYKIFTKATLVNRIYLGLMALMPAKCGECGEDYIIDHEPAVSPFFNCFRCFKGSHDCERNKGLHQTLSAMNTPTGFVWLCDTCHDIVDPIEPRKQRSRHPSGTLPDNQTLNSNSNGSNLDLLGALSSTQNLSSQGPKFVPSQQGEPDNTAHPTKDICQKFLKWNCPHGISGKKVISGKCCPHSHPRVCNQFRESGSTGRNGCKKGRNCAFFHPDICKSVVETGSCRKRDCAKFHPRSS